jgi:AcrR family transcriptional regulator
MGTRRRLGPAERREELLAAGAELFSTLPYEAVSLEDVAERAGVSRALMYHYFPNKRDFFAAIFQRASDRLLASTEPDGARSLADLLLEGIDAHIDYFMTHTHEALAVNSGPLSADPVIQAISSEELGAVRRRILDAVGLQGHDRQVASTALRGWLAFSRAACTDWLEHQACSRDELRAMCLGALNGAMGWAGRRGVDVSADTKT